MERNIKSTGEKHDEVGIHKKEFKDEVKE